MLRRGKEFTHRTHYPLWLPQKSADPRLDIATSGKSLHARQLDIGNEQHNIGTADILFR